MRSTPDAGPQTNDVSLITRGDDGNLSEDRAGSITTENRETRTAEDLGALAGRVSVREMVSIYQSRLAGDTEINSTNTAHHSNRRAVVETALREELTEAHRELDGIKEDRDGVLKELQTAQGRVTELETRIGVLEGDLKKAQGGSARVQEELEAVTKERDDALAKCANLRKELTKAQGDLQDASDSAQTQSEQTQAALNAALRAQQAAQEAQAEAEKELEKAKTGSAEDKAAAKAAQEEAEKLQKEAVKQLEELKAARAAL
ncbi:MAG: hypothetical protein ACRC1U_05245, partial [Vibrionaceae bacterium]